MQTIVQSAIIILAILLGGIILTQQNRLWRIGALAGIFLLQFSSISFTSQWLTSITLLILGWMSCAILGTNRQNSLPESVRLSRSEIIFRLLAYSFFIAASFILSQKIINIFPDLDYPTAVFGIGLVFAGSMLIGFSNPFYEVVFGLLVLLVGFETIYYSLELSLLVVGLLGAVKLGLAFIGSYWYLNFQEGDGS
jgi:hypothetical protein